ncbi:hypothetical protein PFL603g_06252 [Pseudomonas fluorescens]|uniref:Uncharacterized protein n=1 Tax=Pseudomonas fluorescens TaxID=294 RepID=A0A109KIE5_PSEFL|nr:hypothetical protein PFL603g_06252 [Pseudomonas fluorescens]
MAQRSNEIRQQRLLEQRLERHLDTQAMTHTGHHLRRQQRVSAHFEEVITETNPLATQYLRPDRSDLLFHDTHRCNPVGQWLADIVLGQCSAVQFAVGAQGQPIEQYQMRGHHVVRQFLAKASL